MKRSVLALALATVAVLGSPSSAVAACNTDSDCEPGQICMGGECISVCVPDCDGKNCGPNGCGDVCGYCPQGIPCEGGVCSCDPQCGTKECGPDACGSFCGTGSAETLGCPVGYVCDGNTFKCKEACLPKCQGKQCGDDGCGGVCGTCKMEETCEAGACQPKPQCNDDCAAGQKGCEEGKSWTCMKDADGCKIKAFAECPAGTVCVEGDCVEDTKPADEGSSQPDLVGQDDEPSQPGDDAVPPGEDAVPPGEDLVPPGEDAPTGGEVKADSKTPVVEKPADSGAEKDGCTASPAGGSPLTLLLLAGCALGLSRFRSRRARLD